LRDQSQIHKIDVEIREEDGGGLGAEGIEANGPELKVEILELEPWTGGIETVSKMNSG
jgi:hypothetical protein